MISISKEEAELFKQLLQGSDPFNDSTYFLEKMKKSEDIIKREQEILQHNIEKYEQIRKYEEMVESLKERLKHD